MKKEINDGLQKEFWYSNHNFREYDHPIVAFFAHQRVRLIDEKINLSSCNTILDVGCGNGFSTYYLSKKVRAKVYGGDYSLKMLFTHPLNKEIINFDVLHLPFKDKQFDLVNAWEILHHIKHPENAVLEMVRVANKYIVIFEPNKWNPAQFAFALYGREHRLVLKYSKTYLINILKNCGVKKMVFYSKCGFIFPNKTPYFLFNIFKNFNFISSFGISQVIVARV